jgi:hypothetical protein
MPNGFKSVWALLDELLTFAVADLAIANAPIDAAEQRKIAEYIGGKVGEIRESYGSILCAVHRKLDQNDQLAPFDNCIACIRGERDELRDAIAPFIPEGQQVDSVVFLRELLEKKGSHVN